MQLHTLLKPVSLLVMGDFMHDVYTMGYVERISPEAPIPILRVERETARAGGAGNAVLNMISLGMSVRVLGRVGNDISGQKLKEELTQEGVDCASLFVDGTFQTPVKKRMIADNQQLLRVDYETCQQIDLDFENQVIKLLPEILKGISLVAISDYGKGFVTPRLAQELIQQARAQNIRVIVDPKGNNFEKYAGAYLVKPNWTEAVAAAGLDKKSAPESIAARIFEKSAIEKLMITRSKEGISIFTCKGEREDFAACVHEVKDVTGAGDTVLAVIAATLANNLDLKVGAFLANVAAGIAIERMGCARINITDLVQRLNSMKGTVPLEC